MRSLVIKCLISQNGPHTIVTVINSKLAKLSQGSDHKDPLNNGDMGNFIGCVNVIRRLG